jgi:hypothetical protein
MSRFQDVFHIIVAVLVATHDILINDTSALGFHNVRPEVLREKGIAISKLRERLSLPGAEADDGAILTILFLSVSIYCLLPPLKAYAPQ